MSRSALFQTPLSERARIVYLRDFLTWLYDDRSSEEELAEQLWRWFGGFPRGPLRGKVRAEIDKHLSATRDWPWRTFQAELRAALEGLYDGIRNTEVRASQPIRFTLKTWPSKGKRQHFSLQPVLPRRRDQRDWAPVFLFDFLSDLNNLTLGAMERCARPTCRHLFIRLRAKRRLYCSKRCRNLAVLEGLTRNE